MKKIPYYHVDVFSEKPLSGNGLIVFTESEGFSTEFMQRITQEMRQFESIFLQKKKDNQFTAKVFTCDEELDFAGHPVLGAAAVVHDIYKTDTTECSWEFQLNSKMVSVKTKKENNFHTAIMNQGVAEFGKQLSIVEALEILKVMNLAKDDLYPGLMPVVVSTGLPYLLLPLQKNTLQAKILVPDITERMQPFGAKFIGTLDIPTLSIRTWDNAGIIEDIATGSLGGPCGAYLVKQGFKNDNEIFQLNQGQNIGRPSQLFIEVKSSSDKLIDVFVGGGVCKIASGFLDNELMKDYDN